MPAPIARPCRSAIPHARQRLSKTDLLVRSAFTTTADRLIAPLSQTTSALINSTRFEFRIDLSMGSALIDPICTPIASVALRVEVRPVDWDRLCRLIFDMRPAISDASSLAHRRRRRVGHTIGHILDSFQKRA